MAKIKVGTISGKDAFLKSRNKLNRNDDAVKAGVGVIEPKHKKEKFRQKEKNDLKKYID